MLCQVVREGHIFDSIGEQIEYCKQNQGAHVDMPGKVGWFSNAEDMIYFMMSSIGRKMKNRYFTNKGISDEDMIYFFNYIYDKFDFNIDWRSTPFVFGVKSNILGIRSIYAVMYDEIKYIYKKLSSKSNDINIELHNGFGGVKSLPGIEYESIIKEWSYNIIKNAAYINKKLSFNELIELCPGIDNGTYELYLYGAFDDAMKEYRETGKINIELTGKKSTIRNGKNQIIDKKRCIINDEDIKDTLKSSGNIISDLTICSKSKNPTYISIKKESAQLSSVDLRTVLYNSDFEEAIEKNKEFDDFYKSCVKNNNIAFINFCKMFKIDAKQFYYILLNKEIGVFDVDITSESLGILMKKMLGGNYYYVNPLHCIYIPFDNTDEWKINIHHIRFANKTITFICKLNNCIDCEFRFRTSGIKYKYPYRLFIDVDVLKLMEYASKKTLL